MDNDYELLYLAKEEPEMVNDILFYKYKKILYSKAIKYSSNIDLEDFINEAKLTLYEAVESYQDKYKFITYLNICLDRRLSNYKKQLNRNKHKVLNNSISIDDEDTNIIYLIHDERYNPEKILLEESSYIEIRKKIADILTWKEELIFKLKEQNYTNKEISEITDNNLRTVYNIIDRIKNKILNLVSN